VILALVVTSLMVTGVYATGCCPKNGKVTGGGQIPVCGGKASFGFNAMEFSRDDGPKGELQYIDHVTGMKVHAHIIETLWVAEYLPGNKPYPMRQARFTGPCTVNHEGGYSFIVWVADEGEPGKTDQFYIDIVGPNGFHYENPRGPDVSLLNGNIQIHKPPK
jgi:hypothetical protein